MNLIFLLLLLSYCLQDFVTFLSQFCIFLKFLLHFSFLKALYFSLNIFYILLFLPNVSNIYSHVSESNNNIILSLYFLSFLLFPALTQFPESFFFFPVDSVSFWWLVLYHSRVLNLPRTLDPFSRLNEVCGTEPRF